MGFLNMEDPQNHGFQMVSILRLSNDSDDLGLPPFQETSIWGAEASEHVLYFSLTTKHGDTIDQ